MTNLERLVAHLERQFAAHGVDPAGSVLVIGGGSHDLAALARLGFRKVALSNLQESLAGITIPEGLEVESFPADAEAIALPDASFDLVFAHEVLHHCASPHRALCEMLRVARRHVVILEPNDSAVMRLLVRFRLSFPYELMAVVANGYVAGGVRNSNVPNFIYRWNAHEVWKTASAYVAAEPVQVSAAPYWDLGVDEENLALRRATRIGALVRLLGARGVLRLFGLIEGAMNLLPMTRAQGNKFLCSVAKPGRLHPWLAREADRIVFDQGFGAR